MEKRARKRFRAELRLVERSIVLAGETLIAARLSGRNAQGVVCAALLGRLMTSAQAGTLLTLRGLDHDAMTQVRVGIEILATLKCCVDSRDFVTKYVEADLVRRLKIARAGQLISDVQPDELRKLKRIEADLVKQVEKHSASELKVEQICRTAGMSDLYNIVYRETSYAVHPVPRFVEDLARVDGAEVKYLNFGPRFDNAHRHLVAFAEFVHLGCSHIGVLARLESSRKWKRLHRDLQRIGDS